MLLQKILGYGDPRYKHEIISIKEVKEKLHEVTWCCMKLHEIRINYIVVRYKIR